MDEKLKQLRKAVIDKTDLFSFVCSNITRREAKIYLSGKTLNTSDIDWIIDLLCINGYSYLLCYDRLCSRFYFRVYIEEQ